MTFRLSSWCAVTLFAVFQISIGVSLDVSYLPVLQPVCLRTDQQFQHYSEFALTHVGRTLSEERLKDVSEAFP